MLIDLTHSQCEQILADNRYGHLGYCEDGQPYVLPITYAYRDGYVYGHTKEGSKLEALRKHPKACIQVENIDDKSAWQSVMCVGLFEELTDPSDIQEAKLSLAAQYGNRLLEGEKPPVSPLIEDLHLQVQKEMATGAMYRIKADKLIGKAKKSDA